MTRDEKITIATAAALTDVSTETVRNWISRGYLPAVRLGPRLIRIRRADLDNLGKSLTH
ncbi:helix-turn-helix domain-containing protein [Agromyces sp. SYSU K20354]|uniref:helix-turn-helix domain-containing protein n=1 Tax=Agromyces cavernae TaxID=2898659 RepID=UPI001E55A915|nr:helix-turn-helix domain-containing protein [Agromyces cavernae]MCD2443458.1 helix-turn-helix domain-containing protein [Agromyces cavernae]